MALRVNYCTPVLYFIALYCIVFILLLYLITYFNFIMFLFPKRILGIYLLVFLVGFFFSK